MLDGARHPNGHVELGRDRFPGLAHLPLVGHEARFHHRPGAGDGPAQKIGQFLEQGQGRRLAGALAGHHQNRRLGDVGPFAHAGLLFNGENLGQGIGHRGPVVMGDRSLPLVVPPGHPHHLGPDGAHLGPPVFAEDGGHDVAAEGGPGHEEETGILFDVQTGAVGGEAGSQPGGRHARQIPPQMGGAHEEDLGTDPLAQIGQGLAVGPGPVVRQIRMIRHVDRVAPVPDRLIGDGRHVMAQEESQHLAFPLFRQLSGLPHEFPGDVGGLAVRHFNEDAHALVFEAGGFGGPPLFFGDLPPFLPFKIDRFNGADLGALSAPDAGFRIDVGRALRGQVDGPRRTFADADPAGDALVGDDLGDFDAFGVSRHRGLRLPPVEEFGFEGFVGQQNVQHPGHRFAGVGFGGEPGAALPWRRR